MIIPNVIEKKQNSERVYDLYSRLLEDRIIIITGEINDQSANIVVSELLYIYISDCHCLIHMAYLDINSFLPWF